MYNVRVHLQVEAPASPPPPPPRHYYKRTFAVSCPIMVYQGAVITAPWVYHPLSSVIDTNLDDWLMR